jgi:hypothetical protein
MDGACSTYVVNKKYVQKIGRKILRKEINYDKWR